MCKLGFYALIKPGFFLIPKENKFENTYYRTQIQEFPRKGCHYEDKMFWFYLRSPYSQPILKEDLLSRF